MKSNIKNLKEIIQSSKISRIIEVHDPLSAIIVNNCSVVNKFNKKVSFDGVWSSSLTDSALKGYPDIEYFTVNSRMHGIQDILTVSNLPMLVDGDTGGKTEHFVHVINQLEFAGASGVVIEDKTGLKQNSLLGFREKQSIANIADFQDKLSAGLNAKKDNSFMVIARLESLILGIGLKDALVRAEAYIEAGADGILIHSKSNNPDEVVEFAKRYKKNHTDIPLFCVPTTYNQITDIKLSNSGFDAVIYANQMLRDAYYSMSDAAQKILYNSRAFEADQQSIDVETLININDKWS